MKNRREFLRKTALGSFFIGSSLSTAFGKGDKTKRLFNNLKLNIADGPVVISTWRNLEANKAAWKVLSEKNGTALDAVEAGVRIPEGDPGDQSVGYGGRPDREGKVTVDSCIMDHESSCGAVAFLEQIKHPVSVARMVMEKTPHVLLAGEGALQFALENGFKKENLLTEASEKEWRNWLKEAKYKPVINIENHDTIGMLALDKTGNLSGACTTSGAAYKMRGRIGDSPIIGAGLFVDNEIGAATATGLGEAVIRIAGSHLVVELMRQGLEPEAACKEAVERATRKNKNVDDLQIGFVALRKDGKYGAYSIHKGFNYAIATESGNIVKDAGFVR